MEGGCPFCAIAAGERAVAELYRTEDAVSFLDENPAATGHALVVPTTHCEELLTAADAIRDPVLDAVGEVADRLDAVLDPDGFSTFYTSGPLVGTVDHAHVHVVPRETDDGIGLSLDRRELDDEHAAALAERVRRVD
ncbi:HIT family protein [Halovivax limisalsi]|uniref:HIT family protein n=1 Tax=Halovivax limisalsi TaxID=1453760 RepID=UPI001FFDD0A8|nr:HIT family protein [Halovivax limisalsi]